MKGLNQFGYFDFDRFSEGKQYLVTGQSKYIDYESKKHLGTKVDCVIASDKTPYVFKDGNGKVLSNGKLSNNGKISSIGSIPSIGRILSVGRMPSNGKVSSNGKISNNGKVSSSGKIPGAEKMCTKIISTCFFRKKKTHNDASKLRPKKKRA